MGGVIVGIVVSSDRTQSCIQVSSQDDWSGGDVVGNVCVELFVKCGGLVAPVGGICVGVDCSDSEWLLSVGIGLYPQVVLVFTGFSDGSAVSCGE